MFKIETRFMSEGTKLRTLFTSLSQLKTEFSSYAGDQLENLPFVLILVKTKGFGCTCF